MADAGLGPRADYRSLARMYAEQYGLDPDLILRQWTQESGFNPMARSPVGAMGLTQVMPATARDPGYGVTPLGNPNDPNENLRFGTEYMAAMMKKFGGDHNKALVAYNAGPGVAQGWNGEMSSLPTETRNYLMKINGGAGLGSGPTRRRAEAGLPLAVDQGDKPVEYADNFIGKAQRWRDEKQAGMRDRLGIDEEQSEALGGVLQGLGNRMMTGGYF